MNKRCGRGVFASGGFTSSTSKDSHENFGYDSHLGGGFNASTSADNQERSEGSIFQKYLRNRDFFAQRGSNRGGRAGYRGGRGDRFNPLTSADNQDQSEGSIFQKYLGNRSGTSHTFTSGDNHEYNGRDPNRGGRGDRFNTSTSADNQERSEGSIFQKYLGNRSGTSHTFTSGDNHEYNGRDPNRDGRGGYRGGRGRGFNAFTIGDSQESVIHALNRGTLTQSNGNPRGSLRGGRGAYRGQRGNSGHPNQADGNQNADDNIAVNNVHVPHNRISEELFAEDQKAEVLYANVVDDDEDVVVENFNQSLFCLMKWEDAEFEPQLLTNVKERAKYIRPRKVQSVAIPLVLDRYDVISQAETGSGKTAAYLLPIIDDILKGKLCKDGDTFVSEPASPFAIVVVPTRELAQQIYEQAVKFADKTKVSIAKAYGKYGLGPNNDEIRLGCDILVGTPGRLMQFIKSGEVKVTKLRTFVLDEADRLCDDEFFKDILEIVNVPKFPEAKKRQTLLFSAAFPPEVMTMKEKIMVSEAVFVKNLRMLPNKRIKQDFIVVNAQSKLDLLVNLLLDEAEKAGGIEKMRRTLVFVNTKQMSEMAALLLCQRGIRALPINDDRPQHLREQALAEFRSHKVSVLCATDVLERGIDIKELDHVINLDLPINAITYIHRIGRTGRVTQGYATTFFAGNEPLLLEIAKMLRENKEEVPETLKGVVAANFVAD